MNDLAAYGAKFVDLGIGRLVFSRDPGIAD